MFSQFSVSAAENLNATSSLSTLPPISFGNGLVEVSSLTMLIGSSAAVSFVLGSRGPLGLAWAATSAFGMIAVVRACLSAAAPGWLRETIGFRSLASDLAIGFRLELGSSSHSSKRVRSTLSNPIAIQCRGDIKNKNGSSTKSSGNDIYAYDYSTSSMIFGVPETEPGKPTRIFTYARYLFVRNHNKWTQIRAICLSFLKLTESYAFWRTNDNMLAIVTSIPWCYFLFSATIAEVIELRQAMHPETVDILAGKLPTVAQPGGCRKIIIGAARNPKHALFWTIMWSLGVIICTFSMLMTYLLLGKQSTEVILMWVEFQVLWMVVRLVLYYLVQPDDPLANRQLEDQPLSSLPNDVKMRVLGLTMALSKYQLYVHPRGDYSYRYDCFTASEIPRLLTHHAFAYPTDRLDAVLYTIQVSVNAVIGDTTLSSATWVSGSKMTPIELYDSCVVVFNTPIKEKTPSNVDLPSSSSLLAIPAVRVLSGKLVGPSLPADPEKAGIPLFTPKGTLNSSYMISWRYWIPLDSGRWVFLSTPEDLLDVRGQQMGVVMSDAEVTEQLAAGRLNIGLTCVEDVKVALEMSRHSFRDLQSIYQ